MNNLVTLKTDKGENKMSNEPVIEALKTVLADSYMLYLKTQNYHWNVEGPQFNGIHTLLEEQYTDLAAAIDEIAELIRTLGAKAPGNWKAYEALTKIKDGDENSDSTTMVYHLAQDQELIFETLMNGVKTAQNAEDEVVAGALTDRAAVHRKNHWMLNSMLK
jgi:starvation-inducible DNA-binding protein